MKYDVLSKYCCIFTKDISLQFAEYESHKTDHNSLGKYTFYTLHRGILRLKNKYLKQKQNPLGHSTNSL